MFFYIFFSLYTLIEGLLNVLICGGLVPIPKDT